MAAQLAGEANPTLRIAMVAFNRHIAEELQGRLGTVASASTLHGLGYAAILKRVPDCKLDERKAEKLLMAADERLFYQGRERPMPKDEAKAILALASKAKVTATDLKADGIAAASRLIRFFGIDQGELGTHDLWAETVGLLDDCAERTETVDFDDMVWLPTVHGWAAGDFDLLFVDEAQDLGRAQSLLARSAAPSGRIVCVGDRRQAINGFAGADPDSIERIESDLGRQERGLLACPLTVTFRCPQSHVAQAQRLVPHIEAAPWAIDGTVETIDRAQTAATAEPGMLILCRVNAPLLELAYRLIRDGRRATVRGREIGKGLVDLLDRLKADDIPMLLSKLATWSEREQGRLRRRGASMSAIEAVEDKAECLGQLAVQCDTVAEVRESLLSIFSDDGEAGGIDLSSIHRAKGLEAERVMIIAPERLPLIRQDQQPWELRQEMNIVYVALTRSKRDLIFAGECEYGRLP